MIKPAFVIAISALALAAHSQSPAQSELDEVLRQADRSRREYVAGFRDLIGVETRVTELLHKNGTTDKQRTVVSDFLVYRSRFKDDVVTECRITRAVDGKAARNPTDEAMKLFRAIAKARTLAEEIQTLREQNVKHVLHYLIYGLTLQPLPWVRNDFQQGFDFTLAGRERLGERDAVVLGYRSKELRTAGPNSLPVMKRFKNARWGRLGRAWLDAENWRIRRWVDDTMVVDDDITSPTVLERKEIDYEPSPLGGPLPRRIVTLTFDKTGDKESSSTLRPATRITYTYEDFKRFDVTTASEIK